MSGWALSEATEGDTVTPGRLATLALAPVRRLNSEVFPQLGLPTSANFIGQSTIQG